MIEVEHLNKTYGSTSAITDVTFSVDKGEILGFLGPNGAGKTTTMRILAGYLPATSGSAKIDGFDINENSLEVRQRIGYLPENPPLYTEMTIEAYLHFVARIKGISAGDRSNKVQAAMERCSLLDRRNMIIRKLSKGYRQRVGIAQAIVHEPPVIILDEPTVGLDPRQIIEVRNLIKSLAGDRTVIISTHILPEVSMVCSRVTIINGGKVVATNTPENLMNELTGGSGYELEIDGDISLAKQVLLNLADVNLVEPIPKTVKDSVFDERRINLRVICNPNTEPGNHIAATLMRTGFDLYEMRRVSATLEDVFLDLTTQEEASSDSNLDDSLTVTNAEGESS